MAPLSSAPDTDREDPEAVTCIRANSDRLLHRCEGGGGQDSPREERGKEAGQVARVGDDPAVRQRRVEVEAAVIEIRQAPRPRELRSVELERLENASLELVGVRAPGDLLDDEAECDVVRVRVAPHGAGLEDERLGAREAQDVDRPDRRRLAPQVVVRVVHEPRLVLEQLADRDLVTSRNHAGHVVFERAAEAELPLVDELEHDRRRERLRHAAHAKALVCLRAASARRRHIALAPCGGEDDHAFGPSTRKLLRDAPDRRRHARSIRNCRRGGRECDRRRESAEQDVSDCHPHTEHVISPCGRYGSNHT